MTCPHRKLDEAVLAAYGWDDDLGDEAILERLLARRRALVEQQERIIYD